MRVAMYQGGAAVLDLSANLGRVEVALRRAAEQGADVLVTPELFLCGYHPEMIRQELDAAGVARLDAAMARLARTYGVPVVYSLPGVGAKGWTVDAVLLDNSGREALRYSKAHLYGAEERAAFVPADVLPAVVELGGLRLSLLICYDVEFPEAVRAAALAGADLVLVPTALTVGYPAVPELLIPARALENSVAVAYVNHAGQEGPYHLSGGSVLAGPDGAVLARAGDGEELLVADVEPESLRAARLRSSYLADRRSSLYPGWSAG